ncbi:MAG: hypothetical protein HOP29_19575 [Phycisphaerales bacterium]|nr:hypothetical protein [Phycisphaerales bacterium]
MVVASKGAVFAYRSWQGYWDFHQVLTSPSGSSNYGTAVAIDNDVLLVGDQSPNDTRRGTVFVYRFDGQQWMPETTFSGPTNVRDYFGRAVDINNNNVIVGSGSYNGVYFYRYDPDLSEWTEAGADADGHGGVFGAIVVAGDGHLFASDSNHWNVTETAGAVFVYSFDETPGVWTESQRLYASDAGRQKHFGRLLDVDGHWALVGSIDAFYAFRFDGLEWVQTQRFYVQEYGYAVKSLCMSESIAVAGEVAIQNRVLLQVLGYDDANALWAPGEMLAANGELSSPQVEYDVAVQGGTVIVGSPPERGWFGLQTGVAHLYSLSTVTTDFDADGVRDPCDNCADLVNPNQADIDLDFLGDACDGDDDDDGVPDGADNCPMHFNTDQADCDGDGEGDVCAIAVGVSGSDCNTNGTPDECEIADGSLPDCDDDLVPDECEEFVDCNANKTSDPCDTISGFSDDCNGNFVPDECEPDTDCNSNDRLDECDLAIGVSPDCNSDGIPDECQSDADCNANGVLDFCDLAGGDSADCNSDGIPDECQSDADCNANGLRDICDLAGGASPDCNGNSRPDECDVAEAVSDDCDDNFVPDECQIDCNANGMADPCDVASGESEDLDANGILDECEHVHYVRTGGAGDGTQWATAFGDVQQALNAAGQYDELWVAEGTYTPPGQGSSSSFVLSNGADVYGGFGGYETRLEERDVVKHPTVLSGNIGNPASATDNALRVVSAFNLDQWTVVDGFSIVAGRGIGVLVDHSRVTLRNVLLAENIGANGASSIRPGEPGLGAYAANGSQLSIENARVIENRGGDGKAWPDPIGLGGTAGGAGGGVYVTNASSLSMVRCTVAFNSGGRGGWDFCGYKPSGATIGIAAENAAEVDLADCVIEEHRGIDGQNNFGSFACGDVAGGDGFGLYVAYSPLRVDRCAFLNNGGGAGGCQSSGVFGGSPGGRGAGVLRAGDAPATIMNSVFHGNVAGTHGCPHPIVGHDGTDGGGIIGADGMIIENCTIIQNAPIRAVGLGFVVFHPPTEARGGGVWGAAAIRNSIVWDNQLQNVSPEADVSYSCIQNWSTPGIDGNANRDPMFGDTQNGVLRLLPCSPCINAGEPGLTAESGGFDVDGSPRVQCGRIDMGAYELGICYAVGDYYPDGVINLFDHGAFIACYGGPGGGIVAPPCAVMDQDCDHDVDLIDWSFFQIAAGALH